MIAEEELENKLKTLEKSLSCDKNIEENHKCNTDLDQTYGNIGEWVKIRRKCKWYDESKK